MALFFCSDDGVRAFLGPVFLELMEVFYQLVGSRCTKQALLTCVGYTLLKTFFGGVNPHLFAQVARWSTLE